MPAEKERKVETHSAFKTLYPGLHSSPMAKSKISGTGNYVPHGKGKEKTD